MDRKEITRKDDAIFGICLVTVIACGGGYKLAENGWTLLGALLILTGVGFGLVAYFMTVNFFEQRATIIRYKKNVDDLFCVSVWPGDQLVCSKRDEALEGLRMANVTDVRVYTMIFRNVVYTYHWWELDNKGAFVLKMRQVERQGIVIAEEFEHFQAAVTELKARVIDQRRRELYKKNDPANIEQHVLNQL